MRTRLLLAQASYAQQLSNSEVSRNWMNRLGGLSGEGGEGKNTSVGHHPTGSILPGMCAGHRVCQGASGAALENEWHFSTSPNTRVDGSAGVPELSVSGAE